MHTWPSFNPLLSTEWPVEQDVFTCLRSWIQICKLYSVHQTVEWKKTYLLIHSALSNCDTCMEDPCHIISKNEQQVLLGWLIVSCASRFSFTKVLEQVEQCCSDMENCGALRAWAFQQPLLPKPGQVSSVQDQLYFFLMTSTHLNK